MITDGASCECEYLNPNNTKKSFIIMGNLTDTGEFFVTYISTWERNKGFRRAVREMKRKVTCDGDIIELGSNSSGGGGGKRNKNKNRKKDGKGKGKGKGKNRKNKKKNKKGGKKKRKDRKKKKTDSVTKP